MLAAGLWGTPGIAAGLALADDANRSKAAPATGSMPNAPASSSYHDDRRQARRPTSAHSGFQVQPAFGGPHVAMRKARHRSGRRWGRVQK